MASKTKAADTSTTNGTEDGTGTSTTTETTAATNGSRKGKPRPPAAVDAIDFSAVAAEDDLVATASQRTSKWGTLLDQLYAATEAGKVPTDENGHLKFIRLGNFQNPGGARTQVKAFEEKGLNTTYEFKTVVKGKESFLWARVKVTEDEAANA